MVDQGTLTNGLSPLAEFRQEFLRVRERARCLCGSTRSVKLKRRDRYGLPIEPAFCLNCGHVYARYRLSDDALEAFYRDTYRTLYVGKDGLKTEAAGTSRIEAARKGLYAVFRRLFSDVRDVRVLEWGCGAGWNLVPFAEAGVAAYGFDYDHDYIAYGQRRYGLRLGVIEPGIDPVAVMGGGAHFLILNHVLEHIGDPEASLRDVRRFLAPGGYVYVGLPLIEALPTWGWRNFFHVAHLHYFSLPYFASLAQRNGYETMEADGRAAYVTLRPAVSLASAVPRARLHNALQLARFAGLHYLGVAPGRPLRRAVKRIPWLGQRLVALKRRRAKQRGSS